MPQRSSSTAMGEKMIEYLTARNSVPLFAREKFCLRSDRYADGCFSPGGGGDGWK